MKTKLEVNMPDSQSCCSLKSICLQSLLALSLAAASTSCISTEETVYRSEPRMKVEFENDTAGRLFYEALSKMKSHGARSESRTEIDIPLVFEHKRHVLEGDNWSFNEAVRRCDTNGDGKITELEARILAEQTTKQP
jgi:hypothetical protein